MSKIGVAKIFDGSTLTGKVASRSLTAKQIKAAFEEVGYIEFCLEGNDKPSHVFAKTVFQYDPEDLDNRFVTNPRRHPTRKEYSVPTVSSLINNDLRNNPSAIKLMGVGLGVIAEAMQMQRSNDVEPRVIQSYLYTAGAAISAGFDHLNGGNNDQPLNKVARAQSAMIAKRLFDSGLRHN